MTNSRPGWQFPDNNCTDNVGLEDAGTETFAGDADGGLAREICQNSIDATMDKEKPAKVEFSKFTIKTHDIPGYEELKNEINECFNYKGDDKKEGKHLKQLQKFINSENVDCLRISDFNTTGLIGIKDDENDSPFYLLTKGSGTSGKTEGNGGSKGIGKYACFVASDLNTVFYSTKAYNKEKEREEIGHIGISKLRSRPLHDPNRKNLMTMGRGYYAADNNIAPFHEELYLDSNFKRKDGEYGTDIYLIGYTSEDWVSNITYKILEGFMGAIIFNGFEVSVGDLQINKDSLSEIIESDIFKKKSDNERRYLKAQYSLFTSDKVQKKEILVGGTNKITVYVRTYTQNDEKEASKRCEFIRYPYMRIKSKRINNSLAYSAMCIIENNELCEKLRCIEDPAHTEWQLDRLKRVGSDERKSTRELHNQLMNDVTNFIKECLHQDGGDKTDFEGASEYLPADESVENGEGAKTNEAVSITPVRRIKVNNPKTSKSSDEGMGPDFSTGDPEGDDMEASFPGKRGKKPHPNPNPKPPVDEEKKGGKDGNVPCVIKVPLGGLKPKTIYNSKNKGIDVVFTSKFNEDNCELSIRRLGLNNDRYDVEIINASINGQPCTVKDGVVSNIAIKEGVKYKISCELDTEERFSSEVIINAIR